MTDFLPRHVWILIRLRWRLIFATFAGKWGKQAAAILGFILIVAWAAIFASSSYVLLESSRGWDPGKAAAAQPLILRLTFLFTFLLQVATSVATLSVSDFFDTSRLLHLPVRARSIFAAMLLSSVLAPSTLVFGAPIFGAMAALGGPVEMQVFRGLVVLGAILFGQATALFLGYTLLGALSRRRLRDAATILGSVLGLGSYLLIRLMTSKQESIKDWVGSGPLWDGLDFAPPSWFADAAGWTELTPAGLIRSFLPILLALGASLVLGAWSFSRFYGGASATSESDRRPAAPLRAPRFLPGETGAVARQTLAVIWREPQLKAMLFQQMVILVFPFFTVRSSRGLGSVGWWLPFCMVFSHAWLALSLLGIDGSGLRLMLQSPASRARILLGRVLALAGLFALIDVIATAVMVLVMSYWLGIPDPWRQFFPLATASVIADWVLVGAGALFSVLLPFPMVRRGKHLRMRQEGCATNIGRVILRMPVMLLGFGVGVLSILPFLLGLDPIWHVVSVPGGVFTAAVIAGGAIALGARRLVAREEQIVAVMADAGD